MRHWQGFQARKVTLDSWTASRDHGVYPKLIVEPLAEENSDRVLPYTDTAM